MEEIVDMKAKVQLTSKLDALLTKITIGYVRYQIWGKESDDLSWGSVNDRTIDMTRKKQMYESLKKEGPQQARGDTVIKMLMRRSWYSNSVIAGLGGVRIKEVPLLELTEEGRKATKEKQLRPLEGLGRRGGVELLIQAMKEKVKGKNERIKKIGEMKTQTEANTEEKGKLEEERKELEELIEEAQWWTFCILDLGERKFESKLNKII